VTGTQKFVLVGLALVVAVLGLVAVISTQDDSSSQSATTATTTGDPAFQDPCYVTVSQWVGQLVDSRANEAVFESMVRDVGMRSEAYQHIMDIYPKVSQEQVVNGTDAAVELADELIRASCNLVEPVD